MAASDRSAVEDFAQACERLDWYTIWRGLQRLADITATFAIMRSAMPAGP